MEALVFQGQVIQIEAEIFPVHRDLSWIDIAGLDPQPEVRWSWDGVVFSPPPTPPEPPVTEKRWREYPSTRDMLLALIQETVVPAGSKLVQIKKDIAAIDAKYPDQ